MPYTSMESHTSSANSKVVHPVDTHNFISEVCLREYTEFITENKSLNGVRKGKKGVIEVEYTIGEGAIKIKYTIGYCRIQVGYTIGEGIVQVGYTI